VSADTVCVAVSADTVCVWLCVCRHCVCVAVCLQTLYYLSEKNMFRTDASVKNKTNSSRLTHYCHNLMVL